MISIDMKTIPYDLYIPICHLRLLSSVSSGWEERQEESKEREQREEGGGEGSEV